jgi:6-phosphogluconolactonase/glucosamine-6-phosphate isomerase/deaminase
MKFIKTSSIHPAADYMYEIISGRLEAGEKVLWLLTGGSGIKIELATSKRLAKHDLSNLSVILTDERYPIVKSGEYHDLINHPDSNWKQLLDVGFRLKGANMVRILKGKAVSATTEDFDKALAHLITEADYKIGFFGMGPDGHTVGILPASPPANEKSHYAASYNTPNFIRVTMTFKAIEDLDEGVLCAFGVAKRAALQNLRDKNLPLKEQPVQVLKRLPKLTIFNDQIGEVI